MYFGISVRDFCSEVGLQFLMNETFIQTLITVFLNKNQNDTGTLDLVNSTHSPSPSPQNAFITEFCFKHFLIQLALESKRIFSMLGFKIDNGYAILFLMNFICRQERITFFLKSPKIRKDNYLAK